MRAIFSDKIIKYLTINCERNLKKQKYLRNRHFFLSNIQNHGFWKTKNTINIVNKCWNYLQY